MLGPLGLQYKDAAHSNDYYYYYCCRCCCRCGQWRSVLFLDGRGQDSLLLLLMLMMMLILMLMLMLMLILVSPEKLL